MSMNETPKWKDQEVEIDCQEGKRTVPGMVHPYCDGLAVTMARFGMFKVTHIASGRAIGGEYERAGNAVRELVQWEAIARALGFSWSTADADALKQALRDGADEPVPFPGCTTTDADGERPTSIGTWASMTLNPFPGDEFPWESVDDSPIAHAYKILDRWNPHLTQEVPA